MLAMLGRSHTGHSHTNSRRERKQGPDHDVSPPKGRERTLAEDIFFEKSETPHRSPEGCSAKDWLTWPTIIADVVAAGHRLHLMFGQCQSRQWHFQKSLLGVYLTGLDDSTRTTIRPLCRSADTTKPPGSSPRQCSRCRDE